jgi:hypothetical protein
VNVGNARNEQIHQLPFSRWMVDDCSGLQELAWPVKELTQQIAAATNVIRSVRWALTEVLLREHPHVCTAELRSKLEQVRPPHQITLNLVCTQELWPVQGVLGRALRCGFFPSQWRTTAQPP